MNRADWQKLSTERIEDARALLAASQWPGAYYLAGYSLECALKSCIVRYVASRPEIVLEDKQYSKNCWTHDLEDLVKQASLTSERDKAADADPELAKNWVLAKDWTESSRYDISSQSSARNLFDAINDNPDGVLQWVKNFW